ncbi:MAG TPA: hypothetical protein PLX70_11450 [Solirubrobacterales bacterium]|nr:hypothetical protein [Solirubrobacterales bacterium]
MKLSTAARSALTFIIVMIGLAIVGAIAGINVGPVEFVIWLVVLVIGLALIVTGTNRSKQIEN